MSFSDAQITRFAQEAEIKLTALSNAVIDRTIVSTIAGTSEYTLPLEIIDIRRVTYQGKKLDPYSGQEMIGSGSTPGTPIQGIPKFYIFSYRGYPTIKLYPAPSLTLTDDDSDPWATENIRKFLIVEAVFQPDFTSTELRIPEDLRRQFVKYFVNYRCYSAEGPAMDPQAGQYFKARFDEMSMLHREFEHLIHGSVPRQIGSITNKPKYMARPVLPPNFGQREY